MTKYSVFIEETLSKYVEVEAVSKEEADKLVQKMYDDEEIILDSSDFSDLVLGGEYTEEVKA